MYLNLKSQELLYAIDEIKLTTQWQNFDMVKYFVTKPIPFARDNSGLLKLLT